MKVCIVCAIHKFGVSPNHPCMDVFYLSNCQHCGRDRSVVKLPKGAEQISSEATVGELIIECEQLASSWRKKPPKNTDECAHQLEQLVKRWSSS